MNRCTATAVVLAVLLGGASIASAQTAAELARCDELAAYYDRFNRRGEGFSPQGGVDRVIGLERCRKGEVAAGTAQLERAIRMNGFTPPPAR